MSLTIRRFRAEDSGEVSRMIIRTLREVNIRDYSEEEIEKIVSEMTPADIIKRASWTHFYVFLDGDTIAGCGAIGPYWGKEDESSFFTICVLPEYMGRGVGKQIIQTLEKDEYFLRARRVEIPASITACGFYRKFGYDFKNGVTGPDGSGLFRLEKHRSL